MNDNRNLYETDALPLAAWLMTKGHLPTGVNREGHLVSWSFRQSDGLNDDIYTYEQGEPVDNVRTYESARQILYKSINRPEELTILTRGFARR